MEVETDSGFRQKAQLVFEGCSHFRQRIVYATLSGRPIRIEEIRSAELDPGIKDFEASFLRLMDKLTNGSEIAINETGTKVTYKPGLLVGGSISHDCVSRAVGYFLEALICLLPFSKLPTTLTLNGITNAEEDISVDLLRTVSLPQLKHFGLNEGVELKILKRGAPPKGGGQIVFKCPIVKVLNPVTLLDEGKIRRVRGIAYCTRVSPQTANRLVESARGVLSPFVQDVYIYTDHYKGAESGLSPGFALSLVAESTTNTLLSAEATGDAGILPEDVGKLAATRLLEEIANRGCVDTMNQSMMLLFLVLSPESICKIRLGKLSPYTIQTLRHLRDFFGVVFRIEADAESGTLTLTCRSIGYRNIARKVY